VGGIAAATPVQTPETTFSVSRAQAEEVASVVGFVRAYNRRDLTAALGYFTTTRQQGQTPVAATDCNYRRQKTEIYLLRKGLTQWLRRRFADHDRLTIGRIYDENASQLTGVVAVEYATPHERHAPQARLRERDHPAGRAEAPDPVRGRNGAVPVLRPGFNWGADAEPRVRARSRRRLASATTTTDWIM
jgi:hypothetical protein